MSSNAPIGVFDSGIGGLSVLLEIRKLLPAENLLYVADSAHIPYGEKSADFIRVRSETIAVFLQEQGAKALVLACNTATAAAVSDLRERYPDWPIIGMEPALKPATAVTQTGVIGVLATSGTLGSAKFAALRERFAGNLRVLTQPCPGLVEAIEAGDLASAALRERLIDWTSPLLNAGCDTLILGCTHYPFIKLLLAELLPAGVHLIDSGEAVAKRLYQVLAERQLLSRRREAGSVQFYSSGEASQLAARLPALWGQNEVVQILPQHSPRPLNCPPKVGHCSNLWGVFHDEIR